MSVQPTRPVTYDWCVRTGGALTGSQRRALLATSLREYGNHAVDLVRLAAGQRATGPLDLPVAPDTALVDAALQAGREQGPEVEGHGLRTWLFGGALAERDGVELDAELFCVGAMLHDAGTAHAVTGEDFTIRSAQIASDAFALAERPLDDDRDRMLRDGIVAHATAGVTPEESALGTYIQAGALLDLAGIRLIDLPKPTVDEVFRRHPAGEVHDTITRLIGEEVRAVPEGRFAQLRHLGLTLAIRTSPTRRHA